GLVRPDDGTVRWEGRPLDQEARRRVGYMPEERGLYPKMRLVDQVAYFGELSGLDGADARRRAADWLGELGLGERLADRAEELSQGNQQRVQLAAALVHEPDLLVLDEPFGGLDPVGVDVLSDVLRRQAARGMAVVFSSHQLELVERLCDEVTIIEAGRVVAAGDIRKLRAERTRPLVRVELEDGRTQWADDLPVGASARPDGAGVLVELPADGAGVRRPAGAGRGPERRPRRGLRAGGADAGRPVP
ncbi:MAG TPA: ATP-binding cassette domain-containing protein, partial [Acidimicrobiales bacterium]|nr:ATP-binding cassette domain-containing protein [Acidimicrobiales bacterium]